MPLKEKEELNGIVVTWDISGPEIPLSAVEAALGKAKIVADTKQRQTTAFTRAVKQINSGRESVTLADKLKKRSVNPTYQLTEKSVDDTQALYQEGAQIELDLEEGKALTSNDALQEDINEKMQYAQCHRTAQDISNMVKRLFQNNADLYAINPRKGVAYFVPKEHMDFAEQVDTFLRELGGVLWSFPVPKGDESGDKSVKEAIDAGLNTLLQDLEKSVEEWGEDTGARAIKTANERWAMAAAKIEAYDYYLKDRHSVLVQRLNDAKVDMQTKITQLGKDK